MRTRDSYPVVDNVPAPGAAQPPIRRRLNLEPPPLHLSSLRQFPPYRPRPDWLPRGWVHSVHIFPAAYPRSSPEVSLPQRPVFQPTLSKETRGRVIDKARQRLVDLRSQDTEPARNDKVLWICVERYRRSRADGDGSTLFFAHANGMNKETWDPTISSILQGKAQTCISEVWVWDAVNHGDSYTLNEGKLNSMFHWHEGARDLVNFFVHYMPSRDDEVLPTQLARVDKRIASQRLISGFKSRRLVFVGHSFGGTLGTLAALDHPCLFSSLILVDPILEYPVSGQFAERFFEKLTTGALGRRDTWEDREHARAQMLSTPFFRRWDPEVFETYITYGLRETSKGSVTLKTPALQEAIVFSDTWTGCEEAWLRLYNGDLDERVELRWIVPGSGQPEVGGPGKTRSRVWLRKKNASNVKIDGAGHMIPFAKPRELAAEISSAILTRYASTRARM